MKRISFSCRNQSYYCGNPTRNIDKSEESVKAKSRRKGIPGNDVGSLACLEYVGGDCSHVELSIAHTPRFSLKPKVSQVLFSPNPETRVDKRHVMLKRISRQNNSFHFP